MSYYNIGDSFNWFMARVVDNKDPEFLGRAKIRVIHDQTGELGKKTTTTGLEKEELLWAWPISAIQSSSLSYKKINELEYEGDNFVPDWIDAVGISPTGISVGTYVFGFYLDGHEGNIPLIFGTYHKVSMYPEPGKEPLKMLQDQEPVDPKKYYDVAALAKGWFYDPLTRASDGEEGVEKGNLIGQTLPKEPYYYNKLWTSDPKKRAPVDEFPTAYGTEYPYNLTYTSKRGHAIELDDSPGNERIHIWHRSGCYEEISNGPSPLLDDDRAQKYPFDGPKGYQYFTAGGVQEDAFQGRRMKKTMDSSFEVVGKDLNQLLLRDHNVELANTATTKIGNNVHWTIGWDQPPGNRINDNGKTSYNNGGLGSKNFYLDIANNAVQTIGNNYVLSVGVDPANEYRLLQPPIGDAFNFITTVANSQITAVGGQQITTIQQQHYLSIKEDSNVTIEGSQTQNVKGGIVIKGGGMYFDNCGLYVNGSLGSSRGASGSFTSADGKVVTVIAGIITAIT